MATTVRDILAQVEAAAHAKQATAAGRFRDVARRLASGAKVPAAAEVAAILEAAGKTPDQLREQVERHTRRLQWRAAVEAADALAVEKIDLLGRVADADDVLSAARDAHAQTVEPLKSRLGEIESSERLAARARAELEREADPEIQQQIADAAARRLDAAQRRAAVDNQIREREKWLLLPDLGTRPDGSYSEIELDGGRGVLRQGPHPRKTQAEKELPGLRANRDRITEEMDSVQAEIRALKEEAATV